MNIDVLKNDIKEVLNKHNLDNANFDLAFKEFLKYFGFDFIDPKEEAILKKIKGYSNINAIPKEVLEMEDLIPNIIARIEILLKRLDSKYNSNYDKVMKELEAHILSTMINDIVRSKEHKSLYYDYRTAVKIQYVSYQDFKKDYSFKRIVEKDNTGQVKKTIRKLLSATDGLSFFGSPRDFLETIDKFSKTFNIQFGAKNIKEEITEEGINKVTEDFSNPIIYNDNPVLVIIKNMEYLLSENEYTPLKQEFEILLIGYKEKCEMRG